MIFGKDRATPDEDSIPVFLCFNFLTQRGVVLHGFFVDGVLRGAAELRSVGSFFARAGEAAFSIEQPWQSHGVGTVLLERTLLSARNRGMKSLQMHCLVDNSRMQQLARKFEADLKFDFGSVVGEVDSPHYTPLSLMREAVADAHGVTTAWLDAQSCLFGAVPSIPLPSRLLGPIRCSALS